MTKHKSTRAFNRLWQEIVNFYKTARNQDINWLLRSFLISSRQQMQGGFVLPTTVLLLLVVTLVVTALIFRSFSRTSEVIGERQQQVIYNAATPTIDRARAKLEYLFTDDPRFPGGVPPEDFLANMMKTEVDPDPNNARYTLPGETRLDVNGDGDPDNAWVYEEKTADGKTRKIAYSLLMNSQAVVGGNTITLKSSDEDKARALLTRNGPVNRSQLNPRCQNLSNQGGFVVEGGWYRENNNTAIVRKNFQVNAVVLDSSAPNQPAATLEFQQDRQVNRGNKWGAWFRNDLEIYPGPLFRWNGAMHTEGNLFLGSGAFRGFMISSHESCVYSEDASEISVNEAKGDNDQVTFQGQIVNGAPDIIDFDTNDTATIDRGHAANTKLTKATDSVKDLANLTPINLALDPLALFTEDKSISRYAPDRTNISLRDEAWKNNPLNNNNDGRIKNKQEAQPYLDDTYRADNRYGPRPSPAQGPAVWPAGSKVGEKIPDTNTELVGNVGVVGNAEKLGLDGYWERRAFNQGLRVIVGQRLTLADPLSAPTSLPTARPHEALQRRTLRNNVAAVQATAVYHWQTNPDVASPPVACVATTAHPGTAETLKRSATFQQISGTTTQFNDFFTGRGTNGWEYSVPTDFNNASLRKALDNLALFAGDPDGAFPATQKTTGTVHPYPELTRFGDFSNLRRALDPLRTTNSIADNSYIHSSACMLGMLADSIQKLQSFDYTTNSELGNLSTAIGNTSIVPTTADTPEKVVAALYASNSPQAALVRDLARMVYLKEQVELDRGVNGDCPALTNELTRLCPTTTKYTALSYIFPANPRAEDRTDTYINSGTVNQGKTYQAISDTDLTAIALQPKDISTWVLPKVAVNAPSTAAPNDPRNPLIKAPDGTVYRVPFKDTALYDGREAMNVRLLDVDLDLLRQNKPPNSTDTWLPISGVIYAFREDAVREDAIARPQTQSWAEYQAAWDANLATGPALASRMKANPANPLQDPPVNSLNGISPKPVDYYADPERRPYGFRLKNGANLLRTGVDNTYGMSFISDNPVYIQGDFNLHQTSAGSLLEEFTDLLEETWDNFYGRTEAELDITRFARSAVDSWRPTEVLADAVTILSNNFCDGSIEDGFRTAGFPQSNLNGDDPTPAPVVDLSPYGCGNGNGSTSYLNQNRPYLNNGTNGWTAPSTFTPLPANYWQRENPLDPQSPIKVSANGNPFLLSNTGTETEYNPAANSTYRYYRFENNKRSFMPVASETRVNAVIISGIVPSRQQQSYGGFHNFPRLLETWEPTTGTRVPLHIAGAFLQLNFSTSATGPFDQDDFEPTATGDLSKSNFFYFRPPNRRWGYDVGLQYQPPGPVSRRFSLPDTARSEFYNEIASDDPYIMKLRCAAPVGGTKVDPNANCTDS